MGTAESTKWWLLALVGAIVLAALLVLLPQQQSEGVASGVLQRVAAEVSANPELRPGAGLTVVIARIDGRYELRLYED